MENIDSEIILEVDSLGKKFSKSLKKSLYYGARDVLSEMTDIFLPSRDNLSKKSVLRKSEFWALKNINFKLRRGEILGILGENGAGKTTLLKLINGLISPDEGIIKRKGSIGALIALGAGFNPILSGRENLYINASILGFKKHEIDQIFDEIIEFAELREFIDSPVMNYSSGMRARLGFSIASFINADLLLVDEILSVGDLAFRDKSFSRMTQVCNNGSAAIFISHNTSALLSICTRVLWLKKGMVYKAGETDALIAEYMAEQKKEAMGKIKAAQVKTLEQQKYDVKFNNVNIYKVELLDEKCCEKEEFLFGDKLIVRIHYELNKEVGSPHFIVHISYNSEVLIAADMLRDGVSMGAVPSKGCLDCVFESLPFHENLYNVKVFALGKTSIEKLCWPPNETFFTVIPDQAKNAIGEIRKAGIVRSRYTFEFINYK